MVQTGGPILGICFEAGPPNQQYGASDQSCNIFIAHSDGTVKRWMPQQNIPPVQVGQHKMPCKDVYSWSTQMGIFMASAGWDCIVKFYRVNGNDVF